MESWNRGTTTELRRHTIHGQYGLARFKMHTVTRLSLVVILSLSLLKSHPMYTLDLPRVLSYTLEERNNI